LGDPSATSTPKVIHWFQRSKVAAVVWTAMRVWLGIMWIQAGVAKLWGAENPAFLHSGAPGVAGLATHGVPAYSWWGSFLHGFVVPNAGWIGILVAVAEFAIGVALVLGLFTPVAAIGSLLLLFTYVMSGVASVCALYALFAIVLLAMWPTAGWIGVDGLLSGYWQRHVGSVHRQTHFDEASAPAASVANYMTTHGPEQSSITFAPDENRVATPSGGASVADSSPDIDLGREKDSVTFARSESSPSADPTHPDGEKTSEGVATVETLSPL
jgi:thiosulfate dehydrogenase (quinone) large subunit